MKSRIVAQYAPNAQYGTPRLSRTTASIQAQKPATRAPRRAPGNPLHLLFHGRFPSGLRKAEEISRPSTDMRNICEAITDIAGAPAKGNIDDNRNLAEPEVISASCSTKSRTSGTSSSATEVSHQKHRRTEKSPPSRKVTTATPASESATPLSEEGPSGERNASPISCTPCLQALAPISIAHHTSGPEKASAAAAPLDDQVGSHRDTPESAAGTTGNSAKRTATEDKTPMPRARMTSIPDANPSIGGMRPSQRAA